jgi:hypothetical protein
MSPHNRSINLAMRGPMPLIAVTGRNSGLRISGRTDANLPRWAGRMSLAQSRTPATESGDLQPREFAIYQTAKCGMSIEYPWKTLQPEGKS